jgi:hypothetical protein
MIFRTSRARFQRGQIAVFKQLVQNQSIPRLELSDRMPGRFPVEPISAKEREFVKVKSI